MNIEWQWILAYLPNFLLYFSRLTSFFVMAPLLNSRNVPAIAKIGISFYVTILVFSGMEWSLPIEMNGQYILYVLKEVMIGLSIGFIAQMFFLAIQTAGAFVDMQMGFGIANVVDPLTGFQVPIIGNFKHIFGTLIFIALDGHHYLISAIMDSYRWVPLDGTWYTTMHQGSISTLMVTAFALAFSLAFKLAAPLAAALFLVDVALGILAKVSPQFNVFVIGLPLKIAIGLIMLFVFIPGFVYLFTYIFEEMLQAIEHLLEVLQPVRQE